MAAIDTIAGDPGRQNARLDRSLEHLPGQLWLGGKFHLLRDADPAATFPVIGPTFGQVQGPIQKSRPFGTGIGQKHPDLTVGRPAHRAAILHLHPNRVRPLFDKATFVYDEHGLRVAQVFDHVGSQIIPDVVRVPLGPVHKLLDAIGRRRPDRFGQLPAVLTGNVTQQALQIGRGPISALRVGKTRLQPAHVETLMSYVPALIAQRLANNPAPTVTPFSERFPAAVLFADISGFTALTERLAQKGPVGAETLTRSLNAYFGQMIDLITAYGGDVAKFAGDGLTAVWPVENEVGLPAVTLRAAACALAIQAALRDYQADDEARLTLRMGVSAGEVALIHITKSGGIWP